MTKLFPTINSPFLKRDRISLILVVVIAMIFRFFRTADIDHYLLAGADGPYVAIQVRTLFIHGRLAFHDMPGLFCIDAAFAWVINTFNIESVDQSVLTAIRWVDICLPPMAAIPIFLIGREFNQAKKLNLETILVIAFACLNLTPLVVFSYQLQKNAVGVFLSFCVLLFMIRYLRERKPSQLFNAGLFLLLSAITHFGSFSIILLLSLFMIILDRNIFSERKFLKYGKQMLCLLFIFCMALSLVAIFDSSRSLRWLQIPMHLFEAPVILYKLKGWDGPLKGWTMINLTAIHVLCLIGFYILKRKNKTLTKNERTIGWSMMICTFFMSSPLLGLEWANRLYLIAYVPLVVLWLLLFSTKGFNWGKYIAAGIIFMLLSYSLLSGRLSKSFHSIDYPSYASFLKLGQNVGFEKNDVVIARQDLQLLTNWTYKVHGVAQYLFTKKDASHYDHVYIIRQLKGKNSGVRSVEPDHYHDERIVFHDEYFVVTVKRTSAGLPETPGKLFRGVVGTVTALHEDKMEVREDYSGRLRTIRVSWPNGFKSWHLIGKRVKVNADWIPFSLDLRANVVTVLM